ncbi:MAG: hypothetical protein ABIG96_06305 [Candidatus Micrarchaeota archaeon]
MKTPTGRGWAKFIRDAKKANGRVLVVVHPYYWQITRYFGYGHKLRNLVAKSKIPVLILEEAHKAEESAAHFGDRPYFLLTGKGKATPKEGWGHIERLFKAAGIKAAFVAGQMASHADLADDEHTRAILDYEKANVPRMRRTINDECVGWTYAELIKMKIPKVRLVPKVTFPDKPVYGKRKMEEK